MASKFFSYVVPKIAKRLTERRKETDEIFNIRKKAGVKPNTGTAKTIKKVTKIQDKFDRGVAARSAKIKSTQRKAIGAGAAAAAGATVAHGAAKKKFPKYKKVMESDVVIKGGKLGLREKKMGGGMMGRRMNYKKGSKFPDLTGDGKVTFADILKGRGVINGKREKKLVGGIIGLGKAGKNFLKSKEGKEKLKEMSSEKNKKKIKDMASKMKKAFGGGSK